VQKDYEVCITNADFGYIGAHGGDPAQPAYVAGPNVRTWMVIEPTPYLMAARANNTKVRAFEDLIKPGLKVGANTLSSGSNVLVGYVVEALGGKMSDIDQYPAGHDQTCTALKDGNIDIATTFAGQLSSPNAAYQELTATTDINWFVIPPKIRDEINKKYPYFRKVVIQPGWTPKITEPYETLGVHGIFLIDKDVPEEVVYQMTKAVFEHVDELGMAFPALKVLGKDTAAVGATCEIHPGALRYYQENGFKIEVDR
jgi:TRAP transporter TAXI family solute receptor